MAENLAQFVALANHSKLSLKNKNHYINNHEFQAVAGIQISSDDKTVKNCKTDAISYQGSRNYMCLVVLAKKNINLVPVLSQSLPKFCWLFLAAIM